MLEKLRRASMRRREFIATLGGAAAWPLAARAQPLAVRTIGWLSSRSSEIDTNTVLPGFRQGLSETGYAEGRNVKIEYRWAESYYDRLPEFAADLVRRQVAVIATLGGPLPVRAAMAATPTIPIVFASGSDPIRDSLVKSLSRPGGNVTGVHVILTSLGPKRLGLLRELLPTAHLIAFLVNPSNAVAKMEAKEIEDAARSIGQQVAVLTASTDSEIDLSFATLIQQGASALLLASDPFFQVRRDHLVALAAHHKMPVMYEFPEFVRAGGLISYSPALTDTMLQMGVYVGRILNGAKPVDLPVQQSSKFELVINLKTAKALGLTIPPGVLAIADEVID
jgi:putative ABC transport system substrate-binding protein